jgi:DNA-binding protein HU-beta
VGAGAKKQRISAALRAGFVDGMENRPLVSCATAADSAAVGCQGGNVSAGDFAVNKMDLIAKVADTADLSRGKAAEAVDAVLDAIQTGLKDSGEVRLVGFGTFETVKRKASTGRNPRTGEQIQIEASTSVKFKAGKALKDAVG